MGSDQENMEPAMRPGSRRMDGGIPLQQSYQPVPFLTDGGRKNYGPKAHDRGDVHLSHRIRRHKIRKVLAAMIPFVLFLVGISLVSVGFFAYIENESILAIFITSRDKGSSIDYYNLDAAEAGASAAVQTETVTAISQDGRLIVPYYYQADQIGTIRISSVDIDVGVYQGDSEDELKLGAGHYFASLLPGQDGNIVVAAHRTTYFRNLENLKTGDEVEFDTTYGQYTYQVREIKILDGSEFGTIAKPADQEQLTLYTCYPFTYIGNAPKRYVVRCDLIKAELNA